MEEEEEWVQAMEDGRHGRNCVRGKSLDKETKRGDECKRTGLEKRSKKSLEKEGN